MPNSERSEKNLVPVNDSQLAKELAPSGDPKTEIQIGPNATIDLSGLTVEQQQQLKIKHAEAMVEVNQKAQELAADAHALDHALDHTLGTMTQHTGEVASAGGDVTITHSQDNSLGRTEVIMGTSNAAKKGTLTRSQTGDSDHTNLFAGVAVVGFIIVALLVVTMSR